MTDDVVRAIREDLTMWAAAFRRLAETDPCCTAAGLLVAAQHLTRAATAPVPAAPGQRETAGRTYLSDGVNTVTSTVGIRPVRPRRPGPYPPSQQVRG